MQWAAGSNNIHSDSIEFWLNLSAQKLIVTE